MVLIVKSDTCTITAGNTYVTVAHGQSSAPDTEKIIPTPHDDLAGRTFWVSNVDATNFRLNMSTQDLSDHTFGYVILE